MTTTKKTWKPGGIRAIRTATSKDFLHWENQADLSYVDSPPEQLYTNQVKPYHRAPHLLIGFPTRYVERGWSDSMRALPEARASRMARRSRAERYGTAITEGLAHGEPRRREVQALERGLPAARHRAPRHLELRPPIHRLARGGDEVRARRRAQRTLALRHRKLLDRQQQRSCAATRCGWTALSPSMPR